MLEYLISLDHQLFHLINVEWANPMTDLVMSFLTSEWVLRIGYVVAMTLFLWKGTKERRLLVVASVIALAATDLVVSALLKPIIERPRPCHVLTDIHLLVHCGAGFSMPSSHAANAFGQAIFWGMVFKRWQWPLLILAAAISLSRVFVGVHYPADITVGALIGATLGLAFQLTAQRMLTRWGVNTPN